MDFGEDAASIRGELGGLTDDARRVGSVQGEACADACAADVDAAVGERDA